MAVFGLTKILYIISMFVLISRWRIIMHILYGLKKMCNNVLPFVLYILRWHLRAIQTIKTIKRKKRKNAERVFTE